jgi:hypothetical protein
VLAIPIFKREATYRELWREGRLIAFDSRFDDNGEVYEVSARAEGEHTVIDGRRGRVEAPATVVSNHPWNYDVLERTLLFDTQRGRLQQVQVSPAGAETITVAGREVAARKYLVTGDLERELWYDDAGNWLQSASSTTATRSRSPGSSRPRAGLPQRPRAKSILSGTYREPVPLRCWRDRIVGGRSASRGYLAGAACEAGRRGPDWLPRRRLGLAWRRAAWLFAVLLAVRGCARARRARELPLPGSITRSSATSASTA